MQKEQCILEKQQAEKQERHLPDGLSAGLLQWYDVHARKLPWRVPDGDGGRPDPYHVWISEIMLQQTRVEAVKGYYGRFLSRLPDVHSLASVSEDELMKLWQGLGYYNRARNLQRAARMIEEEYDGCFPEEYEELCRLPGIGEYTAGAVASIAFGKGVPAIDGNVYRIYTRLLGDDSDITKAAFKRTVRREVLRIMPPDRPGSFNQAWMDLGACICLPNGEPLCGQCPLAQWCYAGRSRSWQQYPVKPAKKQKRQEDRTVLLLEYQGRYLIQKRPSGGLLAGLWEFPAREGFLSPEELSAFLRECGISVKQIELMGRGEHIFSHVQWHMLGYLVHLSALPKEAAGEEGVWADVREMERRYSIPSAFRFYYSQICPRAEKES